jgi:hypothetical protein
LQRADEKLFIFSIKLCGVEKSHPLSEGVPDQPDRVIFVDGIGLCHRESHTAEPLFRNRQFRLSGRAPFQFDSPH